MYQWTTSRAGMQCSDSGRAEWSIGTAQPVPNTRCVYLASRLSIGTDIALGELGVGPPMFTFPKNFNRESVAAPSNLWVQF